VLFLLLSAAASLPAQQDRPPLELGAAPGTGRLTVTLGDVLQDASLRNALLSGLPLRIRVVAELWRDGLFDSERGRGEWRATVVHDPLGLSYRVESSSDPVERVVPSLEEVTRLLAEGLDFALEPEGPGRYYYLGRVEIETLSLSDLEELGRWLRGDLAPAVAGEEDVEGAVAKGVRRLVVRVLGLPARRFRVRTPTFEVGGGEESGSRDPEATPAAPDASSPPQPPREGTSTLLTVSASMRPRSGVTAIPAPAGSTSVPPESSNSGLTRSLSQ
jgi:hypothetical protein